MLSWLVTATASLSSTVEVVTEAMIWRLIERRGRVGVLFYEDGERESEEALDALKAVGEEVGGRPPELYLAKTRDPGAAKEFGIR